MPYRNLKTMEDYNKQIFLLQDKQKAEIAELKNSTNANVQSVKQNAKDKSDEFYVYAITIMLAQIFLTGLSRYLKHIIKREVHSRVVKMDEAKSIIKEIDSELWHFANRKLSDFASIIMTQLNSDVRILPPQKPVLQIQNNAEFETAKTDERKTVNGFRNYASVIRQNETANETVKPEVETVNETAKTEVETAKETDTETIKKCLFCGEILVIDKRTDKKYCDDKCRLAWHRKHKGFELEKYVKVGKKSK